MKLYLIEAWEPSIELEENNLILALTPEICYKLEKAGLKYKTIEDYYSEEELLEGEEEYFDSLMGWISKIDILLQENIPELKKADLKMGTIYFYYLQLLVEPFILRVYTLNKLFSKIKPEEVVYFCEDKEKQPADFRLWDDGISHYSKLIPLFCNKYDITLKQKKISEVLIESKPTKTEEVESKPEIGSGLKQIVGQSRLYKGLDFYRKHGPKVKGLRKIESPLNIFLLKLEYNGIEIVRETLQRGHNIFVLSDNEILKYSKFGPKLNFKLERTNYTAKNNNNNHWNALAVSEKVNELTDWLNQICDLDVTKLFKTELRFFISEVCPEIYKHYQDFIEFYQKEKIDYVITPHEILPVEFAAVAAANSIQTAKSVCISHGDSIFSCKFRNITELVHFDIQIASNKELENYYKEQSKHYKIPVEIYNSSHRFKSITDAVQSKDKSDDKKSKERVIYLTSMFKGNAHRFNGIELPDTQYYKLQKAIVDHFSKNDKFNFVWKGLPAADQVHNPIPEYIKDKKLKNIEIATNPFIQHLQQADRVICDLPSTGFYESIVGGLPTMSLYHKAFIVRETAVEYFNRPKKQSSKMDSSKGKILKLFSEIPEITGLLEEFLNSDPELYKANLEMNEKSVILILEEIKNGKNTRE
jgi:hypothetical protein